jgi:hypothetical protein
LSVAGEDEVQAPLRDRGSHGRPPAHRVEPGKEISKQFGIYKQQERIEGLTFYTRTARVLGIPDGQTGTVMVIHRFGCRRSYCDLLHE